MSWIKEIDEREAHSNLKIQYERIKKERGQLANILKVHSLNPEALRAHFELYLTLMFGKSDLSRIQREMIAVVVSSSNQCQY